MPMMTGAEREMTELLVESLNLEPEDVADVDPEAPLFGATDPGWGLDSIDALEIALAIHRRYGIEMRSEDETAKAAFASIRSLTQFVEQHRP